MDQIKFKVHTFGCKVNTYDSGLIQKNLEGSGYSAVKDEPRVHVINSCAVTAEATKEAVRMVRRLKAKDPFCTVVVTGCAAQVDTGSFENLPGADLIVANSHKSSLPQILEKFFKGEIPERVFKSNIFRKEELGTGGGEELSHTRSFLKIQDGCNSFCSYCIIPYARGKSRSIPRAELVKRINELYAQGVREVVLTGVHIGDYEELQNENRFVLEDLVEAVLKNTQMPRFRLSSLEPVEVTPRLIELYKQNDRLCRHFHMSIQSAQTDVLKDMKRNYTQAEVISALNMIKEELPGSFVGMDVIVGFPTETHERFEETYLTLAGLPWTRIHVFPYSERQGTKAAVMEVSVPVQERQRRASRLRELSAQRLSEQATHQVGSEKDILVLKDSARSSHGVTRDYWNVRLENYDGDASRGGKEFKVKITGVDKAPQHGIDQNLIGVLV
jgi:threonylcarbamoyladenosine tRNA methylthiotransferase MtaB